MRVDGKIETYSFGPEEARIKGVAAGWYAMDDSGRLHAGPFATETDCNEWIARQ